VDFNGKFKKFKKFIKNRELIFIKKLDLLLIPEYCHMLKGTIVCSWKKYFYLTTVTIHSFVCDCGLTRIS